MRESRTYGSVRGALSNERPYRDRRFAPRHDGTPIPDTTSRPRDAKRPSRAFISRPLEGVGNAGRPLHPRPRVHFALVERTRVTTSTPEHPAFPHAMVLTAYVVLSPVTGLFLPPSSADMVLSKPGWADATPQNLTPASGRQ